MERAMYNINNLNLFLTATMLERTERGEQETENGRKKDEGKNRCVLKFKEDEWIEGKFRFQSTRDVCLLRQGSLDAIKGIPKTKMCLLRQGSLDGIKGISKNKKYLLRQGSLEGIKGIPKKKMVDAILKDFILTDDVLLKVSALLLQEFNNGLSKKGHDTATVKMFPTFVRDVPNGKEQGKFLALDLGGTNFRVLSIDLNGEQFNMMNEIYEIPQSIMLGSGEQLFDHIAECLEHYLEQLGLTHHTLPLGFTFSFPCLQKGLTSAFLVQWTKGFNCSGVQGKDVVQLLRAAVKRRGNVDIDVVAIVNDTTGTLMSCAHKNRDCRVGLIVGTGTNACYMERTENVETWTGDNNDPKQVIVNTEWGAFGDNGCLDFLRTPFDHQIDEDSLNKGKQLFEKMISGMYMGEIVRRIIVKLANEGLMFNGELSEKFKTAYRFKSKYVSNVESDPKLKNNETRLVMQKMNMPEATDGDCEILKLVCTKVSTRAAHLVSAAVATILNKIQRTFTTVGVDGSVYRFHPYFKDLMEKKIEELTNPNYKFDLMLSEDGSGRGAALVAAVAVRVQK